MRRKKKRLQPEGDNLVYDETLTSEIKKNAMDLGVDKIGIAEAERADKTPMFFASPFSMLKDAKTVISLCVKYPEGTFEYSKEDLFVILSTFADTRQTLLNGLRETAFRLAKFLERKGYKAVSLDPNVPIDERRWVSCMLSHRYVGQIAGLGDIGANNFLLTPEWGPRIELTSVVTNAPLKPDGPKLAGKIYEETCRNCFKCVEECPSQALGREKMPPYNFDLNKCLWGMQGWVHLSKIEVPPEDWINARPTALIVVPKYTAKYPFIKVYQEWQRRKGDFSYCLACVTVCPVGKK